MTQRRGRPSPGDNEPNQGPTGPQRQNQQAEPTEYRSSDQVRTALIDGNTFRGKAIQYVVVDGLAVFEGDIVLGTEDEVARRTEQLRAEMSGAVAAGVLISGTQYRWPNCTVPYTIDASLPSQNRVTDAIAHWHANTSFRFVTRTSEADYVTFRPWSGCSSSVGRRGGQQFVNLGSGCTTGNTIHEIGHAVGFWHEQSREDRDAFVTIRWDKIQPGYEHNFNQHIVDGDDVGAYDYGSIMHYPRTAFSIDGSDTITPIDPTAQVGQRVALSAGDIATANSMCAKVIKEVVKDGPWDTRKELVKDIRFDTRKELIFDTRKELIKDRIKEVALDPPFRKPAADVIGPVVTPVQPGLRHLVTPVQPGLRPAGGVPFAVATPHQAPSAAREEAELEAVVGNLDAQLEALAEQIAQLDASRESLQAQYDEMARLLQQAVEAHDQPATP